MNEFKNLDKKRQTDKEGDCLIENSVFRLQEISDNVQKIDKKDQEFIIHRIFEHSVKDGLKLMENNGFTSSDYFDSTIDPNFYIKHPDLVKKVVLEAKNLVKSETDKNRLEKLEASVKKNDILLERGKFKVTGSSFGDSQELKTQEAKKLLSYIDDLYSEFIKDKEFVYKTEEGFRSKGERLGQDALRQIEMSLNSNFYRWNVLNNLLNKLLINSPEKVNNLILSIFSKDKGLKKRYKGGDINLYREKIKKGLESKEDLFTEIVKNSGIKKYDSYESYLDEDTVDKIYGFYGFDPEPTKLRTQYKPLNILVSTEISMAEKELVKEIGDDLIWSDEKGEYKLKENNETKYLTEEKILDKLEDLINQGTDKAYIALGLAGLDSDRAWKMRQDFIDQGAVKYYIARGLAGLDSDRAWKMRQDLINQKVDKGAIAQGLAGLDSDRAWKMRQDLINQKVDKGAIAQGLAGLDSDRAWKMRQDFIDQGVVKYYIARGLAGLDSDRAWKMRQDFINQKVDKGAIAQGLAGLDSDRAWKMRQDFINQKVDKGYIAQGLAGLDSDRAWKMRQDFINQKVDKGAIALGLAGLDSDRAWKMRQDFIDQGVDKYYIAQGLAGNYITFVGQLNKNKSGEDEEIDRKLNLLNLLDKLHPITLLDRDTKEKKEIKYLTEEKILAKLEDLIKEGVDKYYIARGLAGLDSDKAWKMRQDFIKEGVDKDSIARGLAGLDSDKAWKMRQDFIKEGVYKESIARGLAGNYITFVWQLNKNKSGEDEEKVIQSDKLRTGVRIDKKSYLDDIQKYFEKFNTEEKKKTNLTNVNIAGLISSIREIPREALKTMSAKRDNKMLSLKLMHKIFPSTYREIESSIYKRGSIFPGDYLNPSETMELHGGNPEANESGPNNEVLRFREPVSGFIVSNLYSKVVDGFKWSSSLEFPVAKNNIKKGREITIELPKVGSSVVLPRFIDSNIITERVKGIKGEKEFPLSVNVDSFGNGLVLDTKKSEEIIYSLETDEIPRVMKEIQKDEYDDYKNYFVKRYGKEIVSPIMELPEEIDLFLDKIKDRSPADKVILIEKFVRSICYYDMKNKEIADKKRGVSFEEILLIMEERMEEIKNNNKEDNSSNKKYAGVCSDFAILTTAILRKAGFMSGVLTGFNVSNSKSAYTGDAHGTSFVVWPEKQNGNSVFVVDGTPSGIDGISTDSLEEKKLKRESILEEIKEKAEWEIDEIQKVLDSYDEESIEKLTNGQLEKALNNILDYGVERANLEAITTVFQSYWYSPLHKMDLDQVEGKIDFINFFNEEIKRAKEGQPIDEIENSGSKLFEIIRDFIQRFSSGNDKKIGFEIARKIRGLARSSLSQEELKAITVIVSYLEAKKMK